MAYNDIIAITSLFLSLLIFCRSVSFRKRVLKQNDALIAMRQQLDAIKEKECREQEFENSLKQAEVVTELQKSRSVYINKKEKIKAPERYGYAQSMFQSGVQTEKIATTLGMSTHEINQLLTLANLTHP